MNKFIRDAFDLLRFRFHPLEHYIYPAWQPLAWLGLIGVVGALGAQEFQAGLPSRIAFFVVLNLLETLLMSAWLMGWWRWVLKRPFEGSLFPLVVLASSTQLLEPLSGFLPDSMALAFAFPLAVYGVFLLVASVANALGERRALVVLAIIAYLPVALTLLHLAMSLALDWGWVSAQELSPAGANPAQ